MKRGQRLAESDGLVPGCEKSIPLDFEAALAIPGTASHTGVGTATLGTAIELLAFSDWGETQSRG